VPGGKKKPYICPHPLNPGFLEEDSVKKIKKLPTISTQIVVVTKRIRVAPSSAFQ
jgi:hypothetical protein